MAEKDLENQLENISKIPKRSVEIKKIEKQFTTLLCPKGKNECEPAYCTFQITNTCPFLDRWRSMVKKYGLTPP